VSRNRKIVVLVSGASVAGLTAAFWLSKYDFTVTVVERAPHLRPGGQALDVRGPALQIAERMGVLASLRSRSTGLTGISAVNADGEEIYRDTSRTLTGGRFDSPDIEILRDDLCQILYEAIRGRAQFLFDDRVTSISQDETGAAVTFASASPRRFDLVIGADGLHSGVRTLAFGPEKDFILRLGDSYVATFGMPNFLGLERWEVLYQHEALSVGAMLMGLRKDADVRAYVGFKASEPIDYDYRNIEAQKRLVADRVIGGGWILPQIVEHMLSATDFHFDSTSQIRMDSWSRGRVVLVGDAGYSVALATGQGTTVAMVGAYVLAGELADRKNDLVAGIAAYEGELREYVLRNQDDALRVSSEPQTMPGDGGDAETGSSSDGFPDLGRMVQPIDLKDYT